MYLQNLAVSLMQPGQDHDHVAYYERPRGLLGKRMNFNRRIRSAFRTLLGR